MPRRRVDPYFGWIDSLPDEFGEVLLSSIAVVFIQGVASAYNQSLGILAAICIVGYSIFSLIAEIQSVAGSRSVNGFMRALWILFLDLMITAALWSH